jgi:hypothetical protein
MVDAGFSATAGTPDVSLDDCVRGRPGPDDRRRVDGEAELCRQEFQDSLVDVGGALDHHEVPDTVDQLGLRSGAAAARHPVHLLLGHAVVLGIEVIVHELRRAADRSWRFRRSRLQEAASAFERSLGRSRLAGHPLGDHCTGLQGLPSSDGIVVSGNSP